MHNPRYNSVIEQEGQVLETLAGVCDGRSVTVSSGTYTLENVTARQDLSTTLAKITGSGISYKPPPGTRQVAVKFYIHVRHKDGDSYGDIFNYKFKLDGTEVNNSLGTWRSGRYSHDQVCINYVFDIGNVSTDSIANGKLASWDTHKNMEILGCDWGGSWEVYLHYAEYTPGQAYGNIVIPPRLEIQAIGRKSDTTFLNSFFNERKGQVLETLTGVCDGRTITVDSGTYTLENVTAEQDATNSWADLTGSSISYKPPPGTRQIIYKYYCLATMHDGSHLTYHSKCLVDGQECTSFRYNQQLYQHAYIMVFFIMFLILVLRMK